MVTFLFCQEAAHLVAQRSLGEVQIQQRGFVRRCDQSILCVITVWQLFMRSHEFTRNPKYLCFILLFSLFVMLLFVVFFVSFTVWFHQILLVHLSKHLWNIFGFDRAQLNDPNSPTATGTFSLDSQAFHIT